MSYDNASDRVRHHLELAVNHGEFGDRLPSVRELMAELGVSPATVRHAVSVLVRQGLVETISGSGTFIAMPAKSSMQAPVDTGWQTLALGAEPSPGSALDPLRFLVPDGMIDLASGYPDATLQPTALIASAVREAVRRPGTFGRVASEGSGPLRDWFESQISQDRSHRVLVMPGGQAALSLIFRNLSLPGDNILMESPTYAGALIAARAAGLNPVPTATDGEGLDVAQIEEAVVATGARLLYVQPRFQNPTGTSLSAARLGVLLELAERHGLILIEDDWLADLALPGQTHGPLVKLDRHGHVVHVRSLTKSIAPGVRVAAIGSVGAIANRLHRARSAEDFFVSPILQEAALGVVTSPRWAGHLRRLRKSLLERREHLRRLVEAIPELAVVVPAGPVSPLHLWVEVSGIGRDVDLREVALRHGVSIVAGRGWFPGSPTGNHIRLSNAAVGHDDLTLGMVRLATGLAECGS